MKDETYGAVIHKVEEPSSTSYERMNKVLTHATTISLATPLARIPGWVMVGEKKRLCHTLERIKWKDD